jgi:glutamyl-tRNA synthetase
MIYRGRIAPTPTGYLHLGHASTFSIAAERAKKGVLVLRNEDLDWQRSKPVYVKAFMEDLAWLGIQWQEGPDVGGPFGAYTQSLRREWYLEAWKHLRDKGLIYPCERSRKDIQQAALSAPHDDEPLYPPECRPSMRVFNHEMPKGVNWRFRVPDGHRIEFVDQRLGLQCYVAGKDFGDFLVWNRDDIPAYELAVVVDDHAMKITEVVRGEDLLKSTARQLLLYESLGYAQPLFYHAPLVCDEYGRRLAKRTDALSLRLLRAEGWTPGGVNSLIIKHLNAL